MPALYDTIGVNYAHRRKPDPRIGKAIADALGDARSVLNVGAGAGSYEPNDRQVVALEPSIEMIRQRPHGAAPAVQGAAENIPYDDKTFDAALAILTVHHWTDKSRGLREMKRVARDRVVVFTFDPYYKPVWLADYLPELPAIDRAWAASINDIEAVLGPCTVTPVPVPHDCEDGFLYAYWRRPSAYLDVRVRNAMSVFSKIVDVEGKLARLEDDVHSGAWAGRYGHLLRLDELDCGYRLIVAEL